jgi:hypothetical protein
MDVTAARDLARVLLRHDRNRWAHVEATAERARELWLAVPPADRDLLVAAAWLHDVGYAEPLRVSGFHPLDGARYLDAEGHPVLAGLVAHHSGARFVAQVCGLTAELDRYPFHEDPLTDALTYADQTAGPQGQRVTVAERLADTLRRHGPDAPTARAHHLREPYILATAHRVQQRHSAGDHTAAD